MVASGYQSSSEEREYEDSRWLRQLSRGQSGARVGHRGSQAARHPDRGRALHPRRRKPESEEQEVLTYRTELDAIEKRLDQLGLPLSVRRLCRGLSPAEDLIKVVAEEGADLLVIGIRRRSRTGKLLMGSNFQEILLNAECPVVAVKADYRPAAS